MAEPTDMPFGWVNWMGPMNHVLHGVVKFPHGKGQIRPWSGPLKSTVKILYRAFLQGSLVPKPIKFYSLLKNRIL